jgi:uncharacterized protein YdaU (DUF1376 family)
VIGEHYFFYMSNDPAFLFYTGDFTTGTQFFTDEQVGIYIRLLMAQHQHGHLSDKQVKMICRTHDEDVMLKFEKDSDGKFFNKRLEDEIFKRKKYSLSRSENKKGKTKDMLIISKSYDNHMENENENENKDINKDKSKIKNLNGISYEISKLSLVMQSEDSWLESIARKYKCSITFATDKILDFIIHLEAQGEEAKTLQDAKSHYDNWFRIQKDLKLKTKNNATNRKAGSPIPQDELLQAVAKAYGYTNTNT